MSLGPGSGFQCPSVVRPKCACAFLDESPKSLQISGRVWGSYQSFRNSRIPGVLKWLWWLFYRKNMQRNKQVAMGRKKFNMDPKKVSGKAAARAHSL